MSRISETISEVGTIKMLLLGKDKSAYEQYREQLIKDYGYDIYRILWQAAVTDLIRVGYSL